MTRMTRMARVIKARHLFTALATVLALVPPAASADAGSTLLTGHGHDGGAQWTGTWETAPSGTAPALPGASIRNVVHTSVGGSAARVRVSNRLGTAPLNSTPSRSRCRNGADPRARTPPRGRCASPRSPAADP